MIDYMMLGRAQDYYDANGYRIIDAPWLVSEQVSNITRPEQAPHYFVTKEGKTKTFVASGEQSFLYLMAKGQLPTGKFQTITPCIRNDAFDELHVKYFMKCELIHFSRGAIADEEVDDVVEKAMGLFKALACRPEKLAVVRTRPDNLNPFVDVGTTYDITYGGVEIGSYGRRRCVLGEWIYGTGLAEPRFSRIDKSLWVLKQAAIAEEMKNE
jgi:hypothetical protein